MVEMLRRLRQEHASMARLLDVLERQIAVFRDGEDTDYDIIEAIAGYCLTYPDLCHHPKEDLVYRALRAIDPEAADVEPSPGGKRAGCVETGARRVAAVKTHAQPEARHHPVFKTQVQG